MKRTLRCHFGSFIVQHKHFTCTITIKRLKEDFPKKKIVDGYPNLQKTTYLFNSTPHNI